MTVLPEFHDQLQAAARRQAQRRLPRAGIALRGSLGTIVVIGLSTAVVLAVAVVALTAVRAGRGTTPAAKPRSSVASSAPNCCRRSGRSEPRRPWPTAAACRPGSWGSRAVRTPGVS